MTVLLKIFYKPYLLLFLGLVVWLYYFASNNPIGPTLSTIFALFVYIIFMRFIFSFLRNSLLKLLNRITSFNEIPNAVLSGYLFIVTLFAPIPVIIIALISKFFIHFKLYDQTYTDDYGNQITRIRSLTPTVLLRRKENKDEYIAVTKLKKKPKKITYE